jgi:DNA-binding NarL/FixJ family response regulator
MLHQACRAIPERGSHIRIGIVDRSAMFSQGLAALFASTSDFRAVVLEPAFESAPLLPNAATVAVWIIDAADMHVQREFASNDERSSTTNWREKYVPEVGFVVLDSSWSAARQDRVLQRGYDAYVSKAEDFDVLLQILFRLDVVEQMRNDNRLKREVGDAAGPGKFALLSYLTGRELDVLRHLAHGHSVRDCSRLLSIAPSTIENHKANIMKKLKVHKTVDLVRIAIRSGLVEA